LVEYFRRDSRGGVSDTQYALVSPGETSSGYGTRDDGPFEPWAPWGRRDSQPSRPQPWGGFFGLWQQPQQPPPRYEDPRYQRNQERYRAERNYYNVPRY
jgi:hypothetical protein